MVNLTYLICYDITEDDVRTSVSNICKDAGLQRIQYSVFTGKMSKADLKSLRVRLESELSDCTGQILILPACSSCVKKRELLSSSAEEEADEVPDPMEEEEVLVF